MCGPSDPVNSVGSVPCGDMMELKKIAMVYLRASKIAMARIKKNLVVDIVYVARVQAQESGRVVVWKPHDPYDIYRA